MSNFEVRYALLFSGSDIGQQINNALADLPSQGGRIIVSSGSYAYGTAIDLTTGGKNVILQGDGMGNTILTFSGGATPALKVGSATSGLITVRDLTFASSNPVAGQFGIYANGNNNNVCIERVEIKTMGDDAVRTDGPSAILSISNCYIHANASGYAVSVTGMKVQNLVVASNEIFNNKGGINVSGTNATGIVIRDNDIETGGTGTGSNPVLTITGVGASVTSSGNTYGAGALSTLTDLVLISCQGFSSIGDQFSLGTSTQTCLHFSSAAQCVIVGPILSAPGGGAGTAIKIDSTSKDITIINPTYYNGFTTTFSDAGVRTSNLSYNADAIMAFFGKQANLTGQTASIGSTALYAANGADVYRVSYYLMTTTAGTGGTCSVTVGWNDGSNAHTSTSATISSAAATAFQSGTIVLRSGASQPINYSTTVSGALGSPQYALYLRLEEI